MSNLSARYNTGLVVGKFAPLHKGHQLVIDTALAACERVIVLSYSKPEFGGCAARARATWLETLYPQCARLVVDDAWIKAWNFDHPDNVCPFFPMPENDASESVHRDFVGWLCVHVFGQTVDAVFASEPYLAPFAEHLRHYFKECGFAVSSVAAVMVDEARQRVNVSGTAIRERPYRERDMLDARVEHRIPGRIAILGGESSGKSTLTTALAERLDGVAVEEYGRTLWEEKCGKLVFDDFLEIARTQIEAENSAAFEGKNWVVCDTSPLTTLFYSQEYFGSADPELVRLAERRYDFVLLCAPDFPFVQDGTRREASFRDTQHAWYRRELDARHIPYQLLEGTVAERLNAAVKAIAATLK